MVICQIQWIDRNGQFTPDTNPAIGLVWVVRHTTRYGIVLESPRIPICAVHMLRLAENGMHNWRFAAQPGQ